MSLPQPFGALVGQDVRCRSLIGHAAHEAAFEAALGDDVDHRHLLGDADWLVAVGERVSKDQEPRPLGLARKDAEHDGGSRDHAGRGLVMLIDHDTDA